jgi:hypothetical protein
MAETVVATHFAAKIKDLGVQVCTILADNLLLAVWIVVEYWFEHYLVPKFPVTSEIGIASLWVFRVIFAVSTVCPSVIFLYRDLRIIWMRAQATIKEEGEALRAKAASEHGR